MDNSNCVTQKIDIRPLSRFQEKYISRLYDNIKLIRDQGDLDLVPIEDIGNLGLIDIGGMAYLGAVRLAGEQDIYAIKIWHKNASLIDILPEFNKEISFQQEASELILAPKIFHKGTVDKVPYLLMDYISGENCNESVMSGDYTPEIIKRIAEVSDSLNTLHQNGIVHGDIKPENIIFNEKGAVILDYGSAVRVYALDNFFHHFSGNTLVGTPYYVAPECCFDKEISPFSDQYSLGLTLGDLVSKRLLLKGDDPSDLIEQKEVSLEIKKSDLIEGYPSDLVGVINICLKRDPVERFDSCGELSLLLQSLL